MREDSGVGAVHDRGRARIVSAMTTPLAGDAAVTVLSLTAIVTQLSDPDVKGCWKADALRFGNGSICHVVSLDLD